MKQDKPLVVKKAKPRIPLELIQRLWKRNAGTIGNKKYSQKVKHKKQFDS